MFETAESTKMANYNGTCDHLITSFQPPLANTWYKLWEWIGACG